MDRTVELDYYHSTSPFTSRFQAIHLTSPAGFKEASFIEGRLMRVAKKKIEILVDDEETGEPSLKAVRLADGVNISLDTIGEDVKAVVADGKVVLISPLKIDVSRDEANPVSC